MEHIINKRIKIKVRERDNFGKYTNNYTEIEGICTYIGPNKDLDIPLQVTLDRTPFKIRHINDITPL